MLEILVSLRRETGIGTIGGSSNSVCQTGYIIAIRKAPAFHIWGTMERQYMLVTYMDDASLEAELGSQEVWTNPLARWQPGETLESGKQSMMTLLQRGCFRVDLSMFEGTDGLNPDILTTAPTSPNGKPALKVTDLIYSPPDPLDNKAVLLDCTGKKSALSNALLTGTVDCVDKLVYVKDGKVWRHGLDVPTDRTPIILDAAPSVMGFPTAKALIDAGLPRTREVGARYAIFGRTTDLPGVVTACLKNNTIPLRPILGWSPDRVSSECTNLGIEFERETLVVEGQTVIHDVVVE